VTLNADGSETVTVTFFFLPMIFQYNASGQLTAVFLGLFPLLVV
jgi:hypothetical protein